eukprot:6614601-Prorocentrum_lima.AAC.1
MTSSLVGSEMCIRDSNKIGQQRLQPESLEASTLRQNFEPMDRMFPGPVSYTHLTLPTICSV